MKPTQGTAISRRTALKMMAGAGAWWLMGETAVEGSAGTLLKKPIPKSGEKIPVIGLGTARTFDVTPEQALASPLLDVMRLFVERGGTVVDSSPMYGYAESVIGALASKLDIGKSLFYATKVWTRGKRSGIRQMEQSMRRMGADRIDLIQVHNLSDWRTQLNTLKEWKKEGRIRYDGVTHYTSGAFDDIAEIIKRDGLDFIEIPYSIVDREAEARLLSVAMEHGTAVIAHTPYGRGGLFRMVKGKPVPDWAKESDIRSWGQFFLKYLVSHPACTCAIPATTKPKHLVDNMGAAYGRLPDAETRRRMAAYMDRL